MTPIPPLKRALSLARKPYSCKPREENKHDGKALLELLLGALSFSLHPYLSPSIATLLPLLLTLRARGFPLLHSPLTASKPH